VSAHISYRAEQFTKKMKNITSSHGRTEIQEIQRDCEKLIHTESVQASSDINHVAIYEITANYFSFTYK
jgi:hypothetical protein